MTLEQRVKKRIETDPKNLQEAYNQSVSGTLMHVDELMRKRRDDLRLRNSCCYTADGEVYSVDNGIPTLRITREAVNPIFKHIDEAFDQLNNLENYFVSPEDFAAVKAANDTIAIDLTKLKLSGNGEEEWSYLAVNTSKNLNEHNAEQQKLLLRIFGPSEVEYDTNMARLRTSPPRISEPKIYVLAPDYIKVNAEKGPIARASWLDNINNNSNFSASDCSIVDNFRFRGVRKRANVSELSVPLGADIQDLTLPDHYKAILDAIPGVAVHSLDDKTAAGLLGLITEYYTGKV